MLPIRKRSLRLAAGSSFLAVALVASLTVGPASAAINPSRHIPVPRHGANAVTQSLQAPLIDDVAPIADGTVQVTAGRLVADGWWRTADGWWRTAGASWRWWGSGERSPEQRRRVNAAAVLLWPTTALTPGRCSRNGRESTLSLALTRLQRRRVSAVVGP